MSIRAHVLLLLAGFAGLALFASVLDVVYLVRAKGADRVKSDLVQHVSQAIDLRFALERANARTDQENLKADLSRSLGKVQEMLGTDHVRRVVGGEDGHEGLDTVHAVVSAYLDGTEDADKTGDQLDGALTRTLAYVQTGAAKGRQTVRTRALWIRLGLLCLLVCAFVVAYWSLTRSVSRPLDDIGNAVDALAGGDLDTFVPHIDKSGDVGRLARAVYRFKQETRENARLTAQQSSYKTSLRRQQQTLLLSLAERFESEIGQITNTLASGAAQLSATAQSVANDASSAAERADAARVKADRSRDDVASVCEAGQRIRQTSDDMSASIEDVVGKIETLIGTVAHAGKTFSDLQQASSSIHGVVTLIAEIAERTNLLALNATIEASRAGEAGAGFAVVAREVKSLARQTGSATNQISEQIDIMLDQIRQSSDAMAALDKTAGSAAQSARGIFGAAHGQTQVATDVNQSIQASVKRIDGILGDMGQISSTICATRDSTRQLEAAASEIERMGVCLTNETRDFLEQIREEGHLGDKDEGEIHLF